MPPPQGTVALICTLKIPVHSQFARSWHQCATASSTGLGACSACCLLKCCSAFSKEQNYRGFREHFCQLNGKGCKNAVHCHIYGMGPDGTFNMHLKTYQSFLKVQCHLLSGKREMKVCLSSDRSTFGCAVTKHGEVCVCVCVWEQGGTSGLSSLSIHE